MKIAPKSAIAQNELIHAAFNNKVPKGLKVKEYSWENEYRGTDTAFIEAGMIKPEWFPGAPGNPKGTVNVGLINGEMRVLPADPSFPTDEQCNTGFIFIRRSSKGRLVVSLFCLKQERAKRVEAEDRERAKERTEEAYKKIDKNTSELPTNPDAFAKREIHSIESFMSVIRGSLIEGCGYSGGYSFQADLIDEFDECAARLIKMTQEANIYFSQEKRQKEIADIKGRVLQQYPGIS